MGQRAGNFLVFLRRLPLLLSSARSPVNLRQISGISPDVGVSLKQSPMSIAEL
jgi:hypothetical protein